MGIDLAGPGPEAAATKHVALSRRGGGGRGGGRPTVAGLAVRIAVTWVFAYLVHLVRLDIVLVPLVLLGFASVLRTGAWLVDRLMVAALVAVAAILVLGLVTSLTPVKLATAPQAALLLTAVQLAAWFSGRAPRIPWKRVRVMDLFLLGVGVYVFRLIHKPVAGKSATAQLRFSLPIEDRITHFSLYDAVHQTGQYGFFHHFNAGYPQGMHYLFAWLDEYVRTVSKPAGQLDSFFRYFLFVQVAYAVLVVAIIWAARWVIEPYLRGWRSALVQVAVGGVAVLSPFPLLVSNAFDSELFGLLLLAVSIALLVRPAHSAMEHLVLGGAGTITVAYTYNAYVVFVVGAFVLTTFVYRRHFRGRLRFLGVGYCVALAIAGFPSVYATLAAGMDYGAQAMITNGAIIDLDTPLIAALALLSLTAIGTPVARRLPRPWTAAGAAGGAVLILAVFGLWQRSKIGGESYYFSKFLTAVYVILLVTAPTAAFLALRGRRGIGGWRGAEGARLLRSPRTLVFGIGAPLLAVVTVAAGLSWGVPGRAARLTADNSPLQQWARGKYRSDSASAVAELYKTHPHGFGPGPVVVLANDNGYQNFRKTRFYMTLLGRNEEGVKTANAILWDGIGGPGTTPTAFEAGVKALETVSHEASAPPVFLIWDQATAEKVRARLAQDGVAGTVIWYQPNPANSK